MANVEEGDYVRFITEGKGFYLGETKPLPQNLGIVDLLKEMDLKDNIKKSLGLAPWVHGDRNPITLYNEFLSHKEVLSTYTQLNEINEEEQIIKFPEFNDEFEKFMKASGREKIIPLVPLIGEILGNLISPLFKNYVDPESELGQKIHKCLVNFSGSMIKEVDWFKDYNQELNGKDIPGYIDYFLKTLLHNNLLIQTLEQQIHSEDSKLVVKFPENIYEVEQEDDEQLKPKLKYEPFEMDENMVKTTTNMMTAFRRLFYMLWGKENPYTMPSSLTNAIIDKVVRFHAQVMELDLPNELRDIFDEQMNKANRLVLANLNPQRLEIGFWLQLNIENFRDFFRQYAQITFEREDFHSYFIDDESRQIPLGTIKAFLTYNHPEDYLPKVKHTLQIIDTPKNIAASNKKNDERLKAEAANMRRLVLI